MRWNRGHKSRHVEDRRGQRARMPGGAKGVGGLIGVAVIIVGLFFGQDLTAMLGSSGGGSPGTSTPTGEPPDPATDPEREQFEFVSFVFDDVQNIWDAKFRAAGQPYQFSTMVVYRQGTESGCGYGTAAIGPFYCPADQRVYLDLSFFDTMRQRLGAPGDFAQAYVIAHEIGHHLQTITGVSARVDQQQAAAPARKNELSVRQELQADCYAGVWAHDTSKKNTLEHGDLEEGLKAAWAIGDDTLQKRGGGQISPETWTHGSSEQRVRWFKRGYDSGQMAACDTFSGATP
ncbi:MAG TPA: neutral zinc metallopeptidase [Kofleriaceae bacterium]|nr:neutral zinc metallopeptidase [Kofleriaceae bacterium]